MSATSLGNTNSNQSAVLNSPSVVPFEQLDLGVIIAKLVYNAPKKLDTTRVKISGTQTSLRDRLKREIISLYPQVWGKSANLPDEVWAKICEAVDKYIQGVIAASVHTGNFVSSRKQYHMEKSGAFVMKNILTGHDILGNRESCHAAACIIATAEKRITTLDKTKALIGKAWTPEQETMLINARQKLAMARQGYAANKQQIVAMIQSRREQSAKDKANASK